MSDEIEKLKMHSPDLTQENIAKIQALFPGCVTEARDEDGKLALKGRCCRTIAVKDSHHEFMRLDGWHEQAQARPLPHH